MMLSIETTLKLAKLVVEKYSKLNSQPGFITTQNGQKIKVRFSELADALKILSEKDIMIVHRCKDCENWKKSPRARMGNCFPKEFTTLREAQDFCSSEYVERSKEMRCIDETISSLSQKE